MGTVAKRSEMVGRFKVKAIGRKKSFGELYEVQIAFGPYSLCSIEGERKEVMQRMEEQQFHESGYRVLQKVSQDLQEEKHVLFGKKEIAVLKAIAHRVMSKEDILQKTGLGVKEFADALNALGEFEAVDASLTGGRIHYFLTPVGLDIHMEILERRNSEVVRKY